jgi:hypothetical protein
LGQDSSTYDSHPSYKERVDCLQALDSPQPEIDQSAPIMAMLPEIEGLEQEMTAVIEKNVARQLGRRRLAPG